MNMVNNISLAILINCFHGNLTLMRGYGKHLCRLANKNHELEERQITKKLGSYSISGEISFIYKERKDNQNNCNSRDLQVILLKAESKLKF